MVGNSIYGDAPPTIYLKSQRFSYPHSNSHFHISKVWGCSDTNDRGEIIEDVIVENDLCLLNEKQPTYLHPPTGNYYAIDLSLCHPGPVPPGG